MPTDNGDYGSIFNPASDAAQGTGAFAPRVISTRSNVPMQQQQIASPGQDQQLAQAASSAYNQARTDSIARRDKMLGLAQQFGASQLANSQQMYGQQVAQQGQNMVSQGLSNSTIGASLNQGAMQAKSQRDQSIGEQQAQMQLGVYGQVQEQYPDMNTLANLFSQPRSPGSTAGLTQLFSGMRGGTGIGAAAGGTGSASVRGR